MVGISCLEKTILKVRTHSSVVQTAVNWELIESEHCFLDIKLLWFKVVSFCSLIESGLIIWGLEEVIDD